MYDTPLITAIILLVLLSLACLFTRKLKTCDIYGASVAAIFSIFLVLETPHNPGEIILYGSVALVVYSALLWLIGTVIRLLYRKLKH